MNSAGQGRPGDPFGYRPDTFECPYYPTVSKMEQVVLKPCPFCGAEMSIAITDYSLVKSKCYSIVHPDNGCILKDFESSEISARQELVDKWNRRVSEDDRTVQ